MRNLNNAEINAVAGASAPIYWCDVELANDPNSVVVARFAFVSKGAGVVNTTEQQKIYAEMKTMFGLNDTTLSKGLGCDATDLTKCTYKIACYIQSN